MEDAHPLTMERQWNLLLIKLQTFKHGMMPRVRNGTLGSCLRWELEQLSQQPILQCLSDVDCCIQVCLQKLIFEHGKNLELSKCLAEKMMAPTHAEILNSAVKMSEACANIEALPKHDKRRNKDAE